MLGDCEFVFHTGNVAFFTGVGTTRTLATLTEEIQPAFIDMGLMARRVALQSAGWDYNQLMAGLKNTRAVAAFTKVGRAPLTAWDPTSKLVVQGPYRYVRNPMISGVLFILLGEAACFASLPLLIWFAAVFAANAVYLPRVEERGLRRRFGADYEAYRAHVPRWIPRLRPWTGEESGR